MARGSISVFVGSANERIFHVFVDHLSSDTQRVHERFYNHFDEHKTDLVAFMKFIMNFEFSNTRGPYVDYELEICI